MEKINNGVPFYGHRLMDGAGAEPTASTANATSSTATRRSDPGGDREEETPRATPTPFLPTPGGMVTSSREVVTSRKTTTTTKRPKQKFLRAPPQSDLAVIRRTNANLTSSSDGDENDQDYEYYYYYYYDYIYPDEVDENNIERLPRPSYLSEGKKEEEKDKESEKKKGEKTLKVARRRRPSSGNPAGRKVPNDSAGNPAARKVPNSSAERKDSKVRRLRPLQRPQQKRPTVQKRLPRRQENRN